MTSPGHGWRLLAYLTAVVAGTAVHDPRWLAAALGAALLLSGRGRGALLRRALKGVAAVALLVSGGYLIMGAILGEASSEFLLLLNTRLILLATLTAWAVRDIDLDRALCRYPEARRWLSIVRVQIALFVRLAQEFRQAQRSRAAFHPSLASRTRGVAALGVAALDKALHNAEEVTQGMRSRGAFDD